MFENCRKPRPVCVRSVIKAFLIAIVTVAITVPCIRLGQAIVSTSKAPDTIGSTIDPNLEVDVYGVRLTMPTMATEIPGLYQKLARGAVHDDRTPAEKQLREHDMELFGRRSASRSWNTDMVRDGHFIGNIRISNSRSKTPPKSVVGAKLLRQIPHSDDYEKMREVTNVDEYIKSDVISNTRTYRTNSRPNNRQLNKYDSTLQTNAQKAEKYSLTSNKDPHGINSTLGNRDSKEIENSRDENILTSIYRPGKILPESAMTSEDTDISSRPSLELHYTGSKEYDNRFESTPNRQAVGPLNEYYSPTYGTYFGTQAIPEPDGLSPIVISRPSTTSRPVVTSTVQPFIPNIQQPMQMMRNINWRRIGVILVLGKLFLLKMKAIGFLKILYLLLSKLKFVLVALFIKFILLLKLLLVFKLQVIPLLFFSLLPIVISLVYPMFTVGLLSVPGQIINTMLGRVNTAVIPTSTSVSDSSGSSSSIVNNIPGNTTITNPSVQVLKTIPDIIINPLSLFKERSFDLVEPFSPTSQDLYQKLNSENCVQKMACEMVFAEKINKIPSWTNGELRRVSKLFPSEKLENYFKTYDYVKNEMYVNSSTPENWITWCLENYGCNKNNLTNVTDTTH